MNELLTGIGAAVWLGILTSISPCPLATNVAAISYIGKRVDKPRLVLATGLVYTLGRTAAYLVLGIVLVASLLSAPNLSHWLQKYMPMILGPILILAGMVLLGLIGQGLTGFVASEGIRRRAERMGLWGAGLLGFVFALSFCPVSAAIFFGSLLPIAVSARSPVLYPLLYGVGTALPVVLFSLVIASSAYSLARIFDRVMQFEIWARRLTGVLFIGIGIYFSIRYVFRLF
jgi:cytochrome c-type biogenesis protein